MGLNETPSGERVHIGFFGVRNAGKSSLVNAVTGQQISLVSDVKGTTTDPVKKAMELLPIGPVVIIDTPGIDDTGALGEMRAARARQMLEQVQVAVLAVDGCAGCCDADRELLAIFAEKKIPHLIVYTKSDLLNTIPEAAENEIYVSAATGANIHPLKECIGQLAGNAKPERQLLADLVAPNDVVVLVTPIDSAAPKGRLILPQQQTIRELLECGAIPVVTRETELPQALSKLKAQPKLVITDSQAFGVVNRIVPPEVMLTSFSILFARYKGDLELTVRGAQKLDALRDGDRVLISEGCTHHRQCGDIGTEKLPKWIAQYTHKRLEFAFTSGGEFPEQVRDAALVVHCGGCMLTPQQMQARQARCVAQEVPITNYGIAIAKLHGILARSLEPFPDLHQLVAGK